jgi:hypothetical protein
MSLNLQFLTVAILAKLIWRTIPVGKACRANRRGGIDEHLACHGDKKEGEDCCDFKHAESF